MMQNGIRNFFPLDAGSAIKRIRERQGKTLQEIADALGINKGTLSKIENGKQGYTGETIAKIAAALDVRPIDIYNDADKGNVEPGPGLHGRVPLISWVQAGAWHEAADPYGPGDAEDWLYYPKKNGHNVYALRVRGDSMTASHGKTYPEGCIIFVDPDQRLPVSGDRIIAKLEGVAEVTFKVFMQDAGRTWLRPLNPQHPPIFEPFRVLGTVVGKWEDE